MRNLRIHTIIATITTIVFTGFYIHYEKWNAEWWGTNVFWYLPLASCLGFICKFFLEKYLLDEFPGSYLVSPKFFTLLSIGTVLFILMGALFTEPSKVVYKKSQPVASNEVEHIHRHYYYGDYNSGYRYSRAGRIDWSGIFSSDGSSSPDSGSGSDNDSGGEAILFLIILALVLLLIVGSALVPHFWVWACVWSLTLLWLYWQNNRTYLENKSIGS